MLTREAAFCVAKLDGLEDGILPWRGGPAFQFDLGRLIWDVQNVLESQPGGSESGKTLTLDAKTGALLRTGSWSATA